MHEEAVLLAITTRAATMVARDGAGLAAHLHPGFRWTSHRGDRFDGEAYVAANTTGDLRWLGQRLEDADVLVDGDTAVVTALAVDDVIRGQATHQFRLLVTMTWLRRDGRWLCLAGHAGPPIDAQPASEAS